MSHIHIPDGVLPLWLWVGGWLLALALVALAARASGRTDVRRKVPLLAVVASLMLVAMSSEVIPIAYHINLTVVAGVLLGPVLSLVAAFVVDVVLALLGHGGVTVLGLNALLIATEMVLGWALFRLLVRTLGRARVRWAAGLATVIALAVSTTLLVGIVAVAGSSEAARRETGALDPGTLSFENPFSAGVFSLGLFGGDAEHSGEPSGNEAPVEVPDSAEDGTGSEPTLSVRRFAAVVYTLGPIGWLLEALITAALLGYIARVRPSLLWQGALAAEEPRLPAHETGIH